MKLTPTTVTLGYFALIGVASLVWLGSLITFTVRTRLRRDERHPFR